MALPQIDLVKIILPLVIRLCPELKAAQITRGKIIPVSNINPMNEAEEARALNRKFTRPRRRDRRRDSSFVVNLDEAIKCVEKTCGDGSLVSGVLRDCVLVLLKGGTGTGNRTVEKILNPVIECLRTKALGQRNKRTRGKFVRTKGGEFSEIVRLRKGKLHPFA